MERDASEVREPLRDGARRPERRRSVRNAARSRALAGLLVVLALPALLAWLSAPAAYARSERNRELQCLRNLSELGKLLLRDGEASGGYPEGLRGASLLLRFRCAASEIKKGQETLFYCPRDTAWLPPVTPELQSLYDTVDWRDPAVAAGLCSYLVRDLDAFPLDPAAAEPQMVACCPHHEDEVIVLYSDVVARRVAAESLGCTPGEPLLIGPGSRVPMLRSLLVTERRVPPAAVPPGPTRQWSRWLLPGAVLCVLGLVAWWVHAQVIRSMRALRDAPR